MRANQKTAAGGPAAPPQPAASNDLSGLLARAAMLTAPILRARGQTVVMGPIAADVVVDRKPCRLVALLAAAIQELSGYTNRDKTITCMVLRHAVVLHGENPIIMPDAALAPDWLMLGRAKALGVVPVLSWDQGRGPVLTLALPTRSPSGGAGAGVARLLPA